MEQAARDKQVYDLSGYYRGTNKFAVFLRNILTPDECADLIAQSESVGYETALVNIGGGRQKLMSDVRNNDRCIIDNPEQAELLWQRIVHSIPVDQKDILLTAPFSRRQLKAVGLNERLRFLRYDPGTFFAPHFDGSYRRSDEVGMDRYGETSYITFQLYLNEGFGGGATRLINPQNEDDFIDVVPETGAVLMFQHDIYHEGSVLTTGRKYAIRTDVMFSETDAPTYAENPIRLRSQGSPDFDFSDDNASSVESF